MAGTETDLQRALDTILAEARANVAAGRDPDAPALEARIAVAAKRAKSNGSDPSAAQSAALAKLERITAVSRARARVGREAPAAPKPAVSFRRPMAARAKPTVTGTLEVRRAANRAGHWLEWNYDPTVTEWEVRFADRADVRSDYVERGSVKLDATTFFVELPEGDNLFRVNIVGRTRTGRVVRRALLTGVSRPGWSTPWQRRATS